MRERKESIGSSPRGRGKLSLGIKLPNHTGLIPARAGKTCKSNTVMNTVAAHPRAGGENFLERDLRGGSGGSSPRGRGKRPTGDTQDPRPGLIPARAGKTRHESAFSLVVGAHPRAGGENTGPMVPARRGRGSSPRGRGKRKHHQGRFRSVGLIPARAGKTVLRGLSRTHQEAHPRAGGEN